MMMMSEERLLLCLIELQQCDYYYYYYYYHYYYYHYHYYYYYYYYNYNYYYYYYSAQLLAWHYEADRAGTFVRLRPRRPALAAAREARRHRLAWPAGPPSGSPGAGRAPAGRRWGGGAGTGIGWG